MLLWNNSLSKVIVCNKMKYQLTWLCYLLQGECHCKYQPECRSSASCDFFGCQDGWEGYRCGTNLIFVNNKESFIYRQNQYRDFICNDLKKNSVKSERSFYVILIWQHSKEETRSPLHLVQPAPNHSWIRHTIVTVLTNQNAMIDSTALHVTARKVGRAFAAVSHNLHTYSSATYSLQQRDKSEVLAHI